MDVKRTVHIILYQSLIQYGIVIWGGASKSAGSKSHLMSLERAQRAVFKTAIQTVPFPYGNLVCRSVTSERKKTLLTLLCLLSVTTKTRIRTLQGPFQPHGQGVFFLKKNHRLLYVKI